MPTLCEVEEVMSIHVVIPGEAPSTPNLREHWAVKAKRTKAQRAAVARKMPKWTAGPLLIVRLTRVAFRSLDTDNLAAALKGHRDAVAACLRVDDASPLVRWEYHQAKGEPSVVVNAWRAGEQAPEYLRDGCKWGHPGCDVVHPMGPDDLAEDTKRQAALVAGALEPWGPAVDPGTRVAMKGALRASLKRQPKASYTPPRSTPVDAAKEAEVFAPQLCDVSGCHNLAPCLRHRPTADGRRLP